MIFFFSLVLIFKGLKSNFNLQLEESKNVSEKAKVGGEDTDASKKIGIKNDPISVQRREKVKGAMLHAWTSYEKYAWGKDELQVCIREKL